MASTLAGNFTLIGSVANLIVAQRARAGGVTIGFWTADSADDPFRRMVALNIFCQAQAMRTCQRDGHRCSEFCG
jgi:hypothetical protein